jgi:hypothetical protein
MAFLLSKTPRKFKSTKRHHKHANFANHNRATVSPGVASRAA